jgi:hypothetical protein
MKTKLLIVAGLALAISAPMARAQEDWGERRWQHMRQLRMDCEDGSELACERLREMTHEWREDRRLYEYERDRDYPPSPERRWREEERDRGDAPWRDREGYRGNAAPGIDPNVAICLAIETNYNNCVKQNQAGGCAAWLIQLKANHCF